MAQAQGTIVQSIGAVIDTEFPRDQMPHVYDALTPEDHECPKSSSSSPRAARRR